MITSAAWSAPDLAAARDRLLSAAHDALRDDLRFAAAYRVGSALHGLEDDWSDLDLYVVVTEAGAPLLRAGPEGAAARRLFVETVAPVALIHEAAVNAPPAGAFTHALYATPPLNIDWAFAPLESASVKPGARPLFDRVGVLERVAPALSPDAATERIAFFWMVAASLVKHIARDLPVPVNYWLGELDRIVAQIEGFVAGAPAAYTPPVARSVLVAPEQQAAALRALCLRMVELHPATIQRGADVPASAAQVVRCRMAALPMSVAAPASASRL